MTKYKSTKFTGVRYTVHPTRKHGAVPDKYFSIRYQSAGKRKEECLGWATDGWTANKAALTLAELKKAAKTGEGHARLSDKREAKRAAEKAVLAKKKEQERKAVTYNQFFNEHYLPTVQGKKSTTLAREESLHKLWILPVFGRTSIKDIGELHILKVKRAMEKKNLHLVLFSMPSPAFRWLSLMLLKPDITATLTLCLHYQRTAGRSLITVKPGSYPMTMLMHCWKH